MQQQKFEFFYVVFASAEQLITLQTNLAEKGQEMERQIQQLTVQHEKIIRQLQAQHNAEIERICAGKLFAVF